LKQAALDEPAHHAGAASRRAREVARRARRTIGKNAQDAAPRRRQALCRVLVGESGGARFGEGAGGDRPRRHQRLADAHGHAQHGAGRRQRIGGDPVDEPAQRLGHARDVEHAVDGFHALGSETCGIARAPDDPRERAAPERDQDEAARRQRHGGGRAVVVSAGKRQRQQNLPAPHRRLGEGIVALLADPGETGVTIKHGLHS
jgi:hypothetical protein